MTREQIVALTKRNAVRIENGVLNPPAEPPVFDEQVMVDQTIHSLQTSVSDLMKFSVEESKSPYIAAEEPRLLSALAGLQFLCSLLRELRMKSRRLEAAE